MKGGCFDCLCFFQEDCFPFLRLLISQVAEEVGFVCSGRKPNSHKFNYGPRASPAGRAGLPEPTLMGKKDESRTRFLLPVRVQDPLEPTLVG